MDVRGEEGVALILALIVLTVASAVAASAVYFAGSNTRSAEISLGDARAHSIAEAGISEALSILSKPGNNPLSTDLLPGSGSPVTTTYAEGSVEWSAVLDEAASPQMWVITATGSVANPTGPIADLVETVVAHVPLTLHGDTTPSETDAWGYVYSDSTGDPSGCDVTLDQGVDLDAPFYAAGNLCLENTAKILTGPTVVHGETWLKNPQTRIGSSPSPISSFDSGLGCKYRNGPLTTCSPATNVWATTITSTPATIVPPTIDWDTAYLYASPGPYSRCTTLVGMVPAFDNDQGSPSSPDPARRNRSIIASFDLAPATSYTCRTAGGELSYDAVSKVLTIDGMIYIDGDVKVDSGDVYEYDGRGTIYTSGSVLIKNSSLCATVATSGNTCDWTGWDPNTDDMLVFLTEGTGGQTEVDSDATAELKSGEFQGAIYGEVNVTAGTTSVHQGPLIANEALSGQQVTFHNFPTPTNVPVGTPGAPIQTVTLGRPLIYG